MGISQNRGTPLVPPIEYNPLQGAPEQGTPIWDMPIYMVARPGFMATPQKRCFDACLLRRAPETLNPKLDAL